MKKQLNWWVVKGYHVYAIELFDIMFFRRVRKELRKCISYKENSAVNLINQRINNGMYCKFGKQISKKKKLIHYNHT